MRDRYGVPRRRHPRRLAIAVVSAMVFSCTAEAPPDFEFIPVTPHERYEYAFRQLGLETSAMGFAWVMDSRRALAEAALVAPPFQEIGFFDPTVAGARGVRFRATRGQRIAVSVDREDNVGAVFIDLFRVVDDDTRPFRHVANADSGAVALNIAVSRTATYVVRIQPELLVAGRYDITVRLMASLAFPVEGHKEDAIRSGFGASRDGGRREHHGVDIFAPRGTPVLASAAGRVSSTRRNNLGGKVVWLRTEFGSLYHAHLDSVAVRRGREVVIGDTLGFVGNSGNARTTPPHLHFGIYARRPTDPRPYLSVPVQTPPRIRADLDLLGSTGRPTRGGTVLRRSARARSDVLARLETDVPLMILAASGAWFHVRIPDGTTGYIRSDVLQRIDGPVDAWVSPANQIARQDLTATALGVMVVPQGDTLAVLGRFSGYLLVEGEGGRLGWVADAVQLVADES